MFSQFKSLKKVTRAYLSGQQRIPNLILTCNPLTTSLTYIKRFSSVGEALEQKADYSQLGKQIDFDPVKNFCLLVAVSES